MPTGPTLSPRYALLCHPDRSGGISTSRQETLRFALLSQDDKLVGKDPPARKKKSLIQNPE